MGMFTPKILYSQSQHMPQRILKVNDILFAFFGNIGVMRIFWTEYSEYVSILKHTSPIEYQLELMLLLFLPSSIRSKACCAVMCLTSHQCHRETSQLCGKPHSGRECMCISVTNLTQASQIRSFLQTITGVRKQPRDNLNSSTTTSSTAVLILSQI